jgi:hypothetical protein
VSKSKLGLVSFNREKRVEEAEKTICAKACGRKMRSVRE